MRRTQMEVQWKQRRGEIRALKQHITKNIHDAEREVQVTWQNLQPYVVEIERQAAAASSTIAAELAEAVNKLALTLRELAERIEARRDGGSVHPNSASR